MRKIVLLSILIAASLPFVVYADQFDEQTSSEIIKQAETNYKKVLREFDVKNSVKINIIGQKNNGSKTNYKC